MRLIIMQLIHCCLNNTCEQKFKAQIIQVVQKQLLCFQKLYAIQPNLLDSTMAEVEPGVRAALGNSSQFNTLKGAISLCECIFIIVDQNAFENVFGSMMQMLRGVADTQIASFKADME